MVVFSIKKLLSVLFFMSISMVHYTLLSAETGTDTLQVYLNEEEKFVKDQINLADSFYRSDISKADSVLTSIQADVKLLDNDRLKCEYYTLCCRIENYLIDKSDELIFGHLDAAYDYCSLDNDTAKTLLISFFYANKKYLRAEYENSYERCVQFMNNATLSNDSIYMAYAHLLLGDLNCDFKNYEATITNYIKALDLFNGKKKMFLPQIYERITNSCIRLGLYEEAIENTEKGLYYLSILDEKEQESMFYHRQLLITSLFYAKMQLNQINEASIYLDDLKEILEKNLNGGLSKFVHICFGDYYLSTNKLDSAFISFQAAININHSYSKKSAYRENKLLILKGLAEVAKKENNLELSLELYDQIIVLKDSLELNKEKSLNTISDWSTKYQTIVMSDEIEGLQVAAEVKDSALKKSKLGLFLLLLLSGFLVGIVIFFYVKKKRITKEYKAVRLKVARIEKLQDTVANEKKLVELELDALKQKLVNKSNDWEEEKKEPPRISNEEQDKIVRLLLQLIIDDQAYLDNELSLDKLSSSLGVNRVFLSQLINQSFDMNFNQLINYYRSLEAAKLLSDHGNRKYTMEYVAEKSGFKSMSPFNAAFKRYHNTTPSSYRKKMQRKANLENKDV